jgi:hypothetical protein
VLHIEKQRYLRLERSAVFRLALHGAVLLGILWQAGSVSDVHAGASAVSKVFYREMVSLVE